MNSRSMLVFIRAALVTTCFILVNCNLPVALSETAAPAIHTPIQPSATTTFLPLVTKTYATPPPGESLVQARDFTYLGAFRLPDGGDRPLTLEYGGNAMTFNPEHGSLFITGHDRLAYGELPDGSQVAEINIPTPINSRNLDDLPQAEFLQPFHNVLQGYFTGIDEIPRIGMAYYDHPLTGAKIHLAWGQYLSPDPPVATHIWFDLDLSAPNVQGPWFLGNQPQERVNGYMFAIPAAWADAYVSGRYLGTGRFKDGGWSDMGPALFAYRPWQDDGSPPAPGTRLPETTLLLYKSSIESDTIDQCLANYQHPDEWEGGAWITTASGKSAVLFSGTKSNGAKYWYGFINPAGAQYPCVAGDFVGQFPVCRMADGSLCPPEDLAECEGHTSQRGWWSTHFDATLILYDPADLARVAQGQIQPWEPQPYTTLDIDEHLYFQPAAWDADNVGNGDQRRYRIGDAAYDPQSERLYVLELYGEGAKPVVHVWKIGSTTREDGAYTIEIPENGSLQNPTWSPDGQSLLFTRFRSGYNQEPADLFVYTLDSRQVRTLVSDGSGNVNMPGASWNAPTGKIVFSSSREPHDEIYLIRSNGSPGDEQQITSQQGKVAYEPTFSPDGAWVVFEVHPLDVEGQGAIAKARVDGVGGIQALTEPAADCRQPNWSPDGLSIAYQCFNQGQWDIWIMNPDGANPRQVTSGEGDKTDASFSPDSKWLVFSAQVPESEAANLYILRVSDGEMVQVTHFAGYDGAPSWSPDGSKIVFESYLGDPDGSTGTTIWVINVPGL